MNTNTIKQNHLRFNLLDILRKIISPYSFIIVLQTHYIEVIKNKTIKNKTKLCSSSIYKLIKSKLIL